ncbi:MAG: tRNA-dihydrouridine synthase [Candidatus Moranbacteria bacterium]|nr:tRNA-dihydrouridine synthase [Candidatus Moranbacteria bacterium]
MNDINKPFLGFWEKLEKPFFVLAPLANVTDAVFRRVINKYSKPDVMWTEFVSADGLCHPDGKTALLRDLSYTEGERPIVAQLFTAHPKKMFEAAKLVAELGFDGIDINMGCPDKNVMKQGAGANLMKDPKLAQELIIAAREGTIACGRELPISVKTRLGFNEDNLEVWLLALLQMRPAVITVHARTKKEMSKVPARWGSVKRAVEIAAWSGTLIIGNGDVKDLEDAGNKIRETGADGAMLGRAIFGNPWLFDRNKIAVTVEEKLCATVFHTQLFEEVWKDTKSFELMKKHYQAYVNHFPQAKELRAKLMACHSAQDVEKTIEEFLKSYPDIAVQSVVVA